MIKTRLVAVISAAFAILLAGAMPVSATHAFLTGELATLLSNQNVFPSVAIHPTDDTFVAAYNLGGVVMVQHWDGAAWSPVTSFVPADAGATVFGDDLHIVTDSSDNLHVAFIGYLGPLAPATTRAVYYGFYDATAMTWSFEEVDSYSDGAGRINPDDPQVQYHADLGAPVVQWTVGDWTVLNGGHSLNYAVQTAPATWTVEPIHQVEGPGSALNNAVFTIGSDGVAHSSFMLRPPHDGTLPTVVMDYSLMYGNNSTTSFIFTPIVTGDTTMMPGKANSIDLGPLGKVHIAYYEFMNDTLHHITNATGPFVDETVDSDPGTDIGRRCVIDVNETAEILIAYQDHTNGKLKAALSRNGDPWEIIVVANSGAVNARFIGAGFNLLGEVMIAHDAKLAENDKRVLYAFLGNTPPVPDAGGPYVVECVDTSEGSTTVQLDGVSSMDADGDPLTFLWTTMQPGVSFDDDTLEQPVLDVTGVAVDVPFDVTLTVDDGTIMNQITTTVEVVDTTPPTVVCPADIVQIALDPAGNVVEFAPTATDDCDPSVAIITSIPSGGLFLPETSTVVMVTATDAAGLEANCSFTIQIMSLEEAIDSLEEILADLEADGDINSGEANSLTTRLANVERMIANENTNAACSQIQAFINTIQNKIDHGMLDPVTGQSMIDAATSLQTAFGC